ncbi:AAA family ATPase [Desulfobacterales bacterium HSG17]|nr:AAA family ATPase [Desulfobacterales bacterium HSG17]
MKKRILYAEADYEAMVRKNGYFVDKTHYIEKLEQVGNPVFLRPRRFGKSLLCRMLECYYNVLQKDEFEELFGHTWIGRNPTPLRNSFFILHLDFSTVNPSGTVEEIEKDFDITCNLNMELVVSLGRKWFQDKVKIVHEESASVNLRRIIKAIREQRLPSLYVIIDEYDNFANQLIVGNKDRLYSQLMSDEGFFKTFFKTLKDGRKTGAVANVFVTGVLPVTIDELASGFNIASFITLQPMFENMLGFTQDEVSGLLDEIWLDNQIDTGIRKQVEAVIKNQYNGYHFVHPDGESLYNSTILMFFLNWLCQYKTIPKHLTDVNLKTDISWIRRLTASNPKFTEEFVEQLTINNSILYDDVFLMEKFNMSQFFEKGFFPVSFFYLGMLTRQDEFYLKLPNLNMRKIFVEYFNEIHRIDVSTRYTEIMQRFSNDLNLPALFAGYWEQYVSQLPEAVFQQVNENFYRTTFYELCSRYLSRWFTWNVERSYPQGRTDLEFVGKYHETFAEIRIVIEFKYYSNAEFRKFKTSIEQFQLQEEDTKQIDGYIKGLKTEYPEARVSQYVIYCFGNQGFRVFAIPCSETDTQPRQQ